MINNDSQNVPIKEATNVHNSHTQVRRYGLRALSCMQVESNRLRLANQAHLQTLEDARDFCCYLFSGASAPNLLPLWAKLVRSDSGGLRQISPEWLADARNLLSRLQTPSPENLFRPNPDPALAYRLGLLSTAAELNVGGSLATLVLQARIQIRGGHDFGLRELDALKISNPVERASIEASIFLRAVRTKATGLAGWADQLRLVLELLSSADRLTDCEKLKLIHVANSLSLYLFNGSKGEAMLRRTLEISRSLAKAVDSDLLRGHALGNHFYHCSLIAKKDGKTELELEHLQHARELDPGFSDYHYRIAQILHDRKDERAESHYLSALRTSSMPAAIVNDYGCFLAESGSTQLDSWSCIAKFLWEQ